MLEERWADAGFVAHPPQHAGRAGPRRRGALGRRAVHRRVLGDDELPVSRRHTRELRDRLQRADDQRRRRAGCAITHPRTEAARRAPVRPPCARDRRADRARRGLHGLADPQPAPARPSGLRAGRGALLGASPCSARSRRGWAELHACSACRLPWLVLGVGVYPVLIAIAAYAVRQAERNERAFTELVRRPMTEHGLAVRARSSWSRGDDRAVGTLGLRRARTTGDSTSPRARSRRGGTRRRSAASTCRRRRILGIAGLILAYGYDMLWYPVCYTAGYLVLLALVAAPLRRSGAYTLPDFAEIRLGSRGGAPGGERAGGAHRLAVPGAAAAGRGADADHPDRRARLARRADRVRGAC